MDNLMELKDVKQFLIYKTKNLIIYAIIADLNNEKLLIDIIYFIDVINDNLGYKETKEIIVKMFEI